jgi:hypothetical protein
MVRRVTSNVSNQRGSLEVTTMQFIKSIWDRMAEKTLIPAVRKTLFPMIERSKPARGKPKMTLETALLEAIIKDAYISGAEAALKMAAEIDGAPL